MPIISILFTTPSQTLDKSVVYAVLNNIKYSVVPLVNQFQTSNVLHYHKLHGTTNMSIPSLYVILLKMTPINIIVIFVKKNEIPNNGSTTMKIAVILLIPIVLLGENQITRNTCNGHLFGDLYINLIVKTISMAQLISPICPVHNNCLQKDQCCFNFYLYIFH